MLGRQNQNENRTELIFLRDVSSNSEKNTGFRGKDKVPYFSIFRKEGEGWAEVGKEDTVSGRLISVTTEKRYNPEKNPKHQELVDKYGNSDVLKVEIADGQAGETYVWKTGFTINSRTAANSLLNIPLGADIQISLGKKKSGYDSVFIRKVENGAVSDKLVDWRFSLDDIPKPSETMFKGKKMRDYTDVDAFYVEQIKAVFGDSRAPMPEVKAKVPKTKSDSVENEAEPDSEPTELEDESEDTINF